MSVHPILQIKEFFVESPGGKNSHVLLHITEAAEEDGKGAFFALAEVETPYKENMEYIENSIQEIEAEYFAQDTDPASAFEYAIEQANRKSGAFFTTYEHTKIHVLIATLSRDGVHLASQGNPNVFLLYFHDNTSSLTPILEENVEDEKDNDTRQIFPHILIGGLKTGNVLCITSPKVSSYVAPDRLQKIIESRSIGSAAKHLEKILRELDTPESFGGAFIQIQGKNPHAEDEKGPGSQKSLSNLLGTEKVTEHILSPPLLPSIHKIFELFQGLAHTVMTSKLFNLHREKRTETETQKRKKQKSFRRPPEIRVHNLKSPLEVTGKWIWKTLRALAVLFGVSASTVFIVLTNHGGQRRAIIEQRKGECAHLLETIQKKYKRTPPTTKLIAGGLILLSIILIASISVTTAQKKMRVARASYNQLVQTISNKRDQAESTNLYGDEEQAFVLLQEAEELLATLPKTNTEERNTFEKLKKSIQTLYARLEKKEDVALHTITTLSPEKKADTITRVQNVFLLTNRDTAQLTQQPVEGGTAQQFTLPFSGTRFAVAHDEKPLAFLVSTEYSLYRWDPKTTDATALSTKLTTANALEIYNNRLYRIDAPNNQVYRSTASDLNFSPPQSWIKQSKESLGEVVDSAIDGELWIARKNATVLRFEKGIQKDFSIGRVHPQLKTITKIWTSPNSTWLYILEGPERRILVFSKEGTFKKQYQIDSNEHIQDFSIDEEARKAYVLTQSNFGSIPLNHF